MNELAIFIVGLIVSVMVLSSVGILLWAASQEEAGRAGINLVRASSSMDPDRRSA